MNRSRLLCFLCVLLSLAVFVYAESPQPVFDVIYLVPSDQRVDVGKIKVFEEDLKEVQTFFADEMERHGFGRKTFAYRKEIDVYKGRHTTEEYVEKTNRVWFEF